MFCEICNEERPGKSFKADGFEVCKKHYMRWYRYKRFDIKTIYDPNEYIVKGEYTEIVLRDKQGVVAAVTLIDTEDILKCKPYKWHVRRSSGNLYVIATINAKKKVHLHRIVLNYDGKKDVDHINHNGLDNWKQNLRIVSHADNLRNQKENRRGIRRVPSGRYRAAITRNYKTYYLGTFDTFEQALAAREEAEKVC